MGELLPLPEWAKDGYEYEYENDPDYLLKRVIEIEKQELNDKYEPRISFSTLLSKFNIEIDCDEILLHKTFIDVYDMYTKKNGRHIIFGSDENNMYELIIDENNPETFLTNRIRGAISFTETFSKDGRLGIIT